MKFISWIIISILLLQGNLSFGQILDGSWRDLVNGDDLEWIKGGQAIEIAKNVLLYQRDNGGWPKNIQPQQAIPQEDIDEIIKKKASPYGATIDNEATTIEMTFLAHLYSFKNDDQYKESFLRGLEYLLSAQYDNGGWPQFYPTKKHSYYNRITFNDDAMVNVLLLLKKIVDKEYPFNKIGLDDQVIEKIETAFNKGIDCILKTQYLQNGTLTSWCAQYDEVTLEPVKARSYELVSLSGKESAQIVLLLISIDNPSENVIHAIKSAFYWFQDVKIEDLAVIRKYDEDGKIYAKSIEHDLDAEPVWARFMDLETNQPFFCDRDGIKKSSIYDIGLERRLGYRWYTHEPIEILKEYKTWLSKIKKQKPKRKDLYQMTVSKDDSGDFKTIQEAINHAKSFPYERIVISIKNGVYNEKVLVPSWNPMISLIGENRDSTIIRYGDFFDKIGKGRNSTFFTSTLQVDGNDFYATNLTIENNAGDIGQALAIALNADRVKLENCKIMGNQDTFYASGEGNRSYVKNCIISGTTDFIFGGATVLLMIVRS